MAVSQLRILFSGSSGHGLCLNSEYPPADLAMACLCTQGDVSGSAAADRQANLAMACFSTQDLIWPWLVSQLSWESVDGPTAAGPQADLAMVCFSTQEDIPKLIWLWLLSQLSFEWMVLLVQIPKLIWLCFFPNSGASGWTVLLLQILKLIWPQFVSQLRFLSNHGLFLNSGFFIFSQNSYITSLNFRGHVSIWPHRHEYLFVPTSSNTYLLSSMRKVYDSTTL
ncbi:hypothetical protein JAAARDRAFT_49463 [Jaapia argillacea MUCL 33604]|uniref:Uncharacterized protein n=1 Tax=Jaapia argillacea MUCL 33604 TaxID=933084 RepID=A0A067PJW0_9AGAM|nr:hypothetical protein JAAARDRAFT_49463 [Jaapia argillacea MUCL 33604]